MFAGWGSTRGPIALALLIACGAAAGAGAHSPETAAAAEEGSATSAPEAGGPGAAVAAYHAAMSSGDAEAAKALLADDLLVLEQGGLEDLELYTSHHLASDMAFAAAVPSERRVVRTTIVGEVAWVTSVSKDTGEYRGRAIDDLGVELMILGREDGSWKIRAIHWSSRPSR